MSKNGQIIGLNGAKEMLETVLHIPYVKEEHPTGILLVAKPGMGKSMILSQLAGDNVIVLNDLTGYGLEKTIVEMEGMGEGYIIIPDLLRLTARGKGWQAFLTLTNIILEEGLSGVRRADANLKFRKPLRFGIVTACTTDFMYKNFTHFAKIGFASRFGIFSYAYEQSDIERIKSIIVHKRNCGIQKIVIPKKNATEVNIPNEFANTVISLGEMMANGKFISFRSIDFIRRLLKATARRKEKAVVNEEDVRDVKSLIPFFAPPTPFSTDLEYYILKGIPETELMKRYTKLEIDNAKYRLMRKKITAFNYPIHAERLNSEEDVLSALLNF